MELKHTFDVPVPPAQAFEVLRDIERIGPCMPGASIDEVDGDHFSGKVKVKIGPIQVTYRGEADYVEVDPDARTATINARGREARGSGTANAEVRAVVTDNGAGGSTVEVTTDLNVTGKPAQFGRGVMADVGEKLIGRFADCLADELGRQDDEEEPTAAADETTQPATTGSAAGHSNGEKPRSSTTAGSRPRAASDEGEAIDLLEVAGAPVAQRVVPLALGLLLLWLLVRRLRRRS